ncbi:EAL domain-containing protein [Photobacterium angustum]|uniref:EAL domain-containing protein n=1 Tax=Photobacterium angustum TaxID=661 RepID=UPI0005E75FE3|nr:EAL domain-containing protein [Photobacterium angustum]KJG24606.1 hypothetical protein UA39_07880 [Photobacterium angustum]KJG32707.1 hypothetical protein UA36_04465 [Photobacterium angustum]PSW97318.1 EAL domain-containing protein [Photobacterium angustum]PSW99935.1 EAL domain-containing protein [Photobacterium angustum]PSX36492.1 EAL domain-containing protein [Photobacterium angustum]
MRVEKNKKGCLVIDDNENILACLDFKLQPITENCKSKVYAFECLSTVKIQSDITVDNEVFFCSHSTSIIKDICLQQIGHFKSVYYDNVPLISYNMPISCLLDKYFVGKLLSNAKMPIALEITEFDIEVNQVSKLLTISENISRLQGKGMKLWFDDFYYNCSKHLFWLGLINWDVVKMDKSYIHTYYDSCHLSHFLKQLANENTDVVLEGIESQYIYDLIKNHNVKLQGYYISYPKMQSELDEFHSY